MIDWRRAGLPAVMGIVILVATTSGSWWSADALIMSVRVGLREIGICAGGQCEWQSFAGLGDASAFNWISLITYILGWVAGLSLVVGAIVCALQGIQLDYLGKIQTMTCIGFGVFSLLSVITFPGLQEASIGWPVGAAFLGSLGGIVSVRQLESSSGWGGRPGVYVEVKPVTASPPSSTSAVAAAPPSSPVAAQGSPQAESQAQRRAAPAELRFASTRVEIGLREITEHLEDGGTRVLLYTNIGRLAARRLPPEADAGRMTFLDLIPKADGGAVRPMRLTPATEANFDILPEGKGMTSRDSFRRLGRFIQSRNPSAKFEPESVEFFAGKEAKQLIAMKQLDTFEAEYES